MMIFLQRFLETGEWSFEQSQSKNKKAREEHALS
jgi:hypothetical protein